MRHFDDWLRVRTNEGVVDEGFGDVMRWGWGAAKNAASMLGSATGISGAIQKTRRHYNDPRRHTVTGPAYNQEAIDAVNKGDDASIVGRFANRLGLDYTALNTHEKHVITALSNIAIARIYGPRYHEITDTDLAPVWEALQKHLGPKGIQSRGIERPMSLIHMVPGYYPESEYAVERSARVYDRKIASGQLQNNMNPTKVPVKQNINKKQKQAQIDSLLTQHIMPIANMVARVSRGGTAFPKPTNLVDAIGLIDALMAAPTTPQQEKTLKKIRDYFQQLMSP